MTVIALANGMFDVTSERDETVSYVVVLGKSCSCPHFQVRLIGTGKSCKHQVAAEEFAASQPEPFGPVTPFVPLTAEQEAEEAEMVKLFGPTMWGVMLDSWSEAERQAAIRKARAELKQPTQLERAAAKAKTLNDNELTYYAARYAGRVAGAACLLEMAYRLAAARAALACEPRPIPAGVECFLVGATEAERERALEVYQR